MSRGPELLLIFKLALSTNITDIEILYSVKKEYKLKT